MAVGAPALAASAAASSDAALLALEIRWRATVAQVNKADAEYSAIYDALPPHAQDGWSTVPAAGDGLFLKHHAGKPIGLQEIRSFNQACVVDDQWAWGKSPRPARPHTRRGAAAHPVVDSSSARDVARAGRQRP
jgi:hypothetical protein